MTINNDEDDSAFLEGMKKLLDYDEEKIDALLELLTAEETIDLADAITNQDKQRAEELIRTASLDETEEDARTMVDPLDKLADQDAISSNEYRIGDAVEHDDDEATVRITNGPGNTVGIMINGKLRMVDRKEIKKIDENVMGMTMMPDIQRIRELSGIAASEHPVTAPESPLSFMSTQFSDDDAVSTAMAAMETLECALPNIKLADLKMIRKRFNEIQMTMNEGVSTKSRLKKI